MNYKINQKSPSEVIFFGLAVVAIWGTVASSGEPIIRPLRGSLLEPILYSLGYQNSIVFNLSIGYLVSLIFWFLIVYLPEQKRRHVLRVNLSGRYNDFRRDAIEIFLVGCKDTEGLPLGRILSHHVTFRQFFEAQNSSRWHDVVNYLQNNSERLDDVVFELQMLAEEVAYVLTKVDFEDPEVHAFFKRMCSYVYRLKSSNDDYDHRVKHLARFLWEIFTAWNPSEGQRSDDLIEKMIAKI